MKTINELLKIILKSTTDELYVQLPATVTQISSDGNYVSAILHINDDEPDIEVHHIKIRHLESKRAYIYLGIKKNDSGVVRFFDRSIEGYLKSDFDYNSDDRQHDISDNCFELGFIPDKEAYEYLTTADIEIGLKNGFCKISINADGSLNVNSTVATTVTAPTVTINGNVVVNGSITATDEITGKGIALSTHTHTGNLGNPTSAPNP